MASQSRVYVTLTEPVVLHVDKPNSTRQYIDLGVSKDGPNETSVSLIVTDGVEKLVAAILRKAGVKHFAFHADPVSVEYHDEYQSHYPYGSDHADDPYYGDDPYIGFEYLDDETDERLVKVTH